MEVYNPVMVEEIRGKMLEQWLKWRSMKPAFRPVINRFESEDFKVSPHLEFWYVQRKIELNSLEAMYKLNENWLFYYNNQCNWSDIGS